MWPFTRRSEEPVAKRCRWVIELDRYGMKNNVPKFVVERHEWTGTRWVYDKSFGEFFTREEAEDFIRRVGDLPYEVVL